MLWTARMRDDQIAAGFIAAIERCGDPTRRQTARPTSCQTGSM